MQKLKLTIKKKKRKKLQNHNSKEVKVFRIVKRRKKFKTQKKRLNVFQEAILYNKN
jgi:hypothetical protein